MLRRTCAKVLLKAAERFDEEISRDELQRWADGTGGPVDGSDLESTEKPTDPARLEQARLWANRAAAQAKFPSEPLPLGLGLALDALQGDERVAAALEHLLRHIEVRRAGCLTNWTESGDAGARDFERLGVALLLSRTTARSGDLRFLNAGLKMIDWFGAGFIRGKRQGPVRLRNRVLQAARECLECLAGQEAR